MISDLFKTLLLNSILSNYKTIPFFSNQEEALHAFIQPEILDGPNQYFCERCKKKCDARKVRGI